MKHSNFADIVSDKGYWFSIAVGFALGLVTMFAPSKIQVPFIVVAIIIVTFLLIIWYLLIDIINLKRAKPDGGRRHIKKYGTPAINRYAL